MLVMPNKIIFVCSLKFAPGLFKEFTLLGKQFKKNNIDVIYLLSKGYSTLINNENNVLFLTKSRNNKEMLMDFVKFPYLMYQTLKIVKNQEKHNKIKFLFYNPHPLNPLMQLGIKIFSNGEVITVLHEPYKTNKERLEYGILGYLFFSIVNFFQIASIKISDKIITMSPYGSELFQKHFPKYKFKQISANLLLPNIKYTEKKRRYFSFVGRVNKGKGIADFIKTINYCLDNRIYRYNFLLITSSTIDEYIDALNKGWGEILTIINHDHITDGEIVDVILESKAVLILHQTASQSGVLPLAYQLHTPIIARNLKAFRQYFSNSGQLLSANFEPEELILACDKVELYFEEYAENAYSIYDKTFSERNFNKLYKEVINA